MEETKFISKDGKTRVIISQDEYVDNPRYMTDEPFHCEDWSRDYSIMIKEDRERKCSSAQYRIIQFLVWYGKYDAIIDALVKGTKNNRLEYNRSARRWELKEYSKFYGEKEYDWHDAEYFDCRKEDIDLATLLEACYDSTIDEFCDKKYWNDGVKMMSYSFGYYGEVTFHDGFDTSSGGIAWLEKDEFLKYSGCDEERWKNNTLREITWLVDALQAWCDNDVYGFVVEEGVKVKITKEYLDDDHEIHVHENTEWKEVDCCGGFYGEYNKMLPFMFEQMGLKQEDFEEVKD